MANFSRVSFTETLDGFFEYGILYFSSTGAMNEAQELYTTNKLSEDIIARCQCEWEPNLKEYRRLRGKFLASIGFSGVSEHMKP